MHVIVFEIAGTFLNGYHFIWKLGMISVVQSRKSTYDDNKNVIAPVYCFLLSDGNWPTVRCQHRLLQKWCHPRRPPSSLNWAALWLVQINSRWYTQLPLAFEQTLLKCVLVAGWFRYLSTYLYGTQPVYEALEKKFKKLIKINKLKIKKKIN